MWILHAILCENETRKTCKKKVSRVDMEQRNETEEIFLDSNL